FCLGKVLVVIPDIKRRINKFNLLSKFKCIKYCSDQIMEGTCHSRTNVVYARRMTFGHKKQTDIRNIFYINEITALLAILVVWIMRTEKLHDSLLFNLPIRA